MKHNETRIVTFLFPQNVIPQQHCYYGWAERCPTHCSKTPMVRSGDCEDLSDTYQSNQSAPVCYGWEHGESRTTSGIIWGKKIKRPKTT